MLQNDVSFNNDSALADVRYQAHWEFWRIRITGQMMLDGSHKPCTPGHPQSPKRISLWEIHPVYAIDVCKKKSVSSCRVGVDGDWTALDVWLQSDEG